MTAPWPSVDEVTNRIGVAKESICRWIEKRGLPRHQIGRLWKFKLSEVDDWVRTQDASVADDEHGPGRAG